MKPIVSCMEIFLKCEEQYNLVLFLIIIILNFISP